MAVPHLLGVTGTELIDSPNANGTGEFSYPSLQKIFLEEYGLKRSQAVR